jgi:hypothetical protein
MRQFSYLVISFYLILACSILVSGIFVHGTEVVPLGEVDIKLYVVALDGVGGRVFGGVSDVNRTVSGILDAALVDTLTYVIDYVPTGFLTGNYVIGEVCMNVNVTMIRDWESYKQVVEGSNIIIVNAHGETLPVPVDFTKEGWVDHIAEAMASRNVTWVHTAGYPFYYYHHQESGEDEWGEAGFKRLMGHMGKSNVVCHSPYVGNTLRNMDLVTRETLLASWPDLSNAFRVQLGAPLNASDFEGNTILPIWGNREDYMTGAVIKFAETMSSSEFGFYVHIGTHKTYNSSATGSDPPTDSDYWRGYAGAAAALWSNSWRQAAGKAILEAASAVAKAESEGRTKGLDAARQLLQQARTSDFNSIWHDAVLQAIDAKDTAENAVMPNFLDIYAMPLAVLGITGATTTTGLAVRHRRHSHKKK